MMFEALTNTYELNARLTTGQRLDVTKIVDARYHVITPFGTVTKTLDDLTIEYIDHLGDNYLVVTLTPEESNITGKAEHQLAVSFDGQTFHGCVLRPATIEFKPTYKDY